jgi:segregation and condensation protein A
MYKVKLEQFEGPLDLLLSLIDDQKLDISRLSLASVTDQYLEFLEQKKTVTLENLAEFLSIASKLILIKSKSLLPILELTDEEEKEIEDLEIQLRDYRRFKEAAKKIEKIESSGRMCFSRDNFLGIQAFFAPPENINAFDLKKYFLKVLSEIPVREKLEEEIVRDVITLEEKINHLEKVMRERLETSFSELVSSSSDKIEVIVSFLAMLELVKQRIISVEQDSLFQDIRLKTKVAAETQAA